MTDNLEPVVNAETYRRHFGSDSAISDLPTRSSSGNAALNQDVVFLVFDTLSSTYDALSFADRSTAGGVIPGLLEPPAEQKQSRYHLFGLTDHSTQSFPGIFQFIADETIAEAVTSVRPIGKTLDAPAKVYQLHRLTGLNWGQLSFVLGVNRRTLHNWVKGSEVAAKNEERLARALSTVRYIDRGNTAENRSLLLSPAPDGLTIVDLLSQEKYDEVKRLAGRGAGRTEHHIKPIDESARRQLMPERLGEALERAMAGSTGELPEGDGIVRKSRTPKRTKRITKSRAD